MIEAALARVAAQAARDRRRRRAGSRRRAAGRDSTTRRSSPAAIRRSRGSRPPTSGRRSRSTTRRAPPAIPKGVVYHHRGAYLNALSNIIDWGMPRHAVYLWTLPMFHCNGWCFPWTMAANAGTNVCLRKVEAQAIFDAIREHGVTHYCGAPIVHSLLINAPDEMKRGHRRTRCRGAGRRRRAAGGDDRGHGAHGLRHHARVRPDRDLRPGGGVRQARRVGRRSTSARAPSATAARACATRAQEGMTVMDPETMREVPCGRRDDGRDHVPRQHHDEGLPQESRGDGGGVRRRLVPLRRPRGDAARRLREDQGPQQGRHHLRRREHQLARGRGRAVSPSRPCSRPRWSRSPIRSGARRRARSSS